MKFILESAVASALDFHSCHRGSNTARQITLYVMLGIIFSSYQGWGQVQYLYLSTYLSVLDVLEYLVYGNVKVLVLVLVLDQKVLGTYK